MHRAHSTTKMVVRNLSPQMTVERLSSLFSAHGAVRSVRLATDVMTGRCSGIGFVSLDEQHTGSNLEDQYGTPQGERVNDVTISRKTKTPQRRIGQTGNNNVAER